MYDAHPAIAAPMKLRMDYARVVAALSSADTEVETVELESLRGLCGALGLAPGATEGILLFAQAPNQDRVRDALENLRDSELRNTLITDLVGLAMADGKYHIQERKQIHALAAMLVVSPEEVVTIEDYVARSLGGDVDERVVTDLDAVDAEPSAMVRMGGEVAASVTAAGVPLYLVWSNSPRGLTMWGVTAALDALGGGMGPLFGAAVAVGGGLFAYLTVRLLFRAVVGR
ncbi:MAG: TerB family tellurite resistance protein [Alphaproteobacteria bacterium]|nr:TerB family tellurite resistance protein [Alphaproteobacteria bacterium]